MKQKLIAGGIIVALILGYLGISRFASGNVAIKYGLQDGIIEYAATGSDLTDDVLGAENYVVSENERYILSLDSYANPVITDKKTGKQWFGALQGEQANGKYHSALVVHYYNINQSENILYSYESCVEKNQVKVYERENGADVEFLFGSLVIDYVYPELISKDRMEKFLSKMTKDDAEYIKSRYKLLELDQYDDENRTYLLQEYPRLKKEDLYVAIGMESKKNRTRTNGIFESIGYTKEDQLKDNGGQETDVVKSETMRVVISYELTNTGFKAFVEEKNCVFYSDYPLSKIEILPYFNAFSSSDTGYAVLPSGSGALVRLDDKKTAYVEIPIYGENVTLTKNIQNCNALASLPIFGQYRNNSGVLGIITAGEQQVSIVVNKEEFCASVSPIFTLIDNEKFSIEVQNPVPLFANGVSDKRFECEYVLFSEMEEKSAYSQMANFYRERLEKQGILGEKSSVELPFAAKIVNSINYKTTAFGFFPVQKDFGLTTFRQTREIAEEIAEFTGAENLQVILTGWNKRGVNQQAIGKIGFSKSAGTGKEYEALVSCLTDKKISFYLNLNFGIVKPNTADGFSVNSQAARTLNNSIVKLDLNDRLTYQKITTDYRLASPNIFSDVWRNYAKSKYISKGSGVSISELSAYLYGDYTDETCFTRGKAKVEIEKILADMKKSDMKIVGDTGNLYTLPYMDLLCNVSSSSDNSDDYDCDIPFVQMVLHGNINYTTQSLNTTDTLTDTLLKLIETGSGLAYDITANPFDGITESDASHLYASVFDNIKDKMRQNYQIVRDALKGLGKEKIVQHTYVTDEVVCVTYGNGTKIYCNYGLKDFSVDGKTIKAKDYLRIN